MQRDIKLKTFLSNNRKSFIKMMLFVVIALGLYVFSILGGSKLDRLPLPSKFTGHYEDTVQNIKLTVLPAAITINNAQYNFSVDSVFGKTIYAGSSTSDFLFEFDSTSLNSITIVDFKNEKKLQFKIQKYEHAKPCDTRNAPTGLGRYISRNFSNLFPISN